MSWNVNDIETTKPTMADDRSATVGNDEVISKVLPHDSASAKAKMQSLKGQFDHATRAARGHVSQHPLSATLVAAVGGALVTGLLLVLGRQQTQAQGMKRMRKVAVNRLPWLAR